MVGLVTYDKVELYVPPINPGPEQIWLAAKTERILKNYHEKEQGQWM